MKNKEVNQIIAKFMDWYHQPVDGMPEAWNDNEGFRRVKHKEDWEGLFCNSLDMLVPVWQKLASNHIQGFWLNINRHGFENYNMAFFKQDDNEIPYCDSGRHSLSELAAGVTARAILKINGRE